MVYGHVTRSVRTGKDFTARHHQRGKEKNEAEEMTGQQHQRVDWFGFWSVTMGHGNGESWLQNHL